MIPLANSVSRHKRPFVTYSLIGINSLVFLYTLFLGSDVSVFYYKFGVIPDEFTSGRGFEVLLTPEGRRDITTPFPTWGTLFSSMFIHGGLVHFGGNMLYLWVFGDNMEDRMGHLVYLGFYLMAGVAAAWMQIAVDTGSQLPTIGASGAIAGVLGAYLMVYPYSRIRTLVIFFFITVIQIPATLLLGVWILLQFWGGLGTIAGASSGVAYWAHIGGFFAGVVSVVAVRLLLRRPIWPGRSPPPPPPVFWRGEWR